MTRTGSYAVVPEIHISVLKEILHKAYDNPDFPFPRQMTLDNQNVGGYSCDISVVVLDINSSLDINPEKRSLDIELLSGVLNEVLITLPVNVKVFFPVYPTGGNRTLDFTGTLRVKAGIAGKDNRIVVSFSGVNAGKVEFSVDDIGKDPEDLADLLEEIVHQKYRENSIKTHDNQQITVLNSNAAVEIWLLDYPFSHYQNPHFHAITLKMGESGAEMEMPFFCNTIYDPPLNPYNGYYINSMNAAGTMKFKVPADRTDTSFVLLFGEISDEEFSIVWEQFNYDPTGVPQIIKNNVEDSFKSHFLARARQLVKGMGTVSGPVPSVEYIREAGKNAAAISISGMADIPVYTPPENLGGVEVRDVTPLTLPPGVLAIKINSQLPSGSPAGEPSNFLPEGRQMAVAVSSQLVQKFIDEAITTKYGASYPALIPNCEEEVGRKIWLTGKPTMTMEDGRFWLSGQVKIEVDCWPDPEADFSGPVTLNIDGSGNVVPEPGAIDTSMTCMTWFIAFWLPPLIGLIIQAVINSAVQSVAGSFAGAEVASNVSNINFLPGELENLGEIKTYIESVDIYSDSLVFSGQVEVLGSNSSALTSQSITKVRRDHQNRVLEVLLSNGWRLPVRKVISALVNKAVVIDNAYVVISKGKPYLKGNPDQTASNNLEHLPPLL